MLLAHYELFGQLGSLGTDRHRLRGIVAKGLRCCLLLDQVCLSQFPMFCTHCAGSSPLIKVRMKVTFLYSELYLGMSALRQKYPLTSSIKSSALDQSLLKICGRLPIALTSGAGGTSCCAFWGCPPPGGPDPPPGGPDPPPGGPDPPPGGPDPPPSGPGLFLCWNALCMAEVSLCDWVGAPSGWDVVAMVVSSVMVIIVCNGRLVVKVSGLVFNMGLISVCLICWLTVGSLVLLSWLSLSLLDSL